MDRDIKKRGPFMVEITQKQDGHEETYVLHRGKLIHKRWNPSDGPNYSRTLPKYGTVFHN